MSHCSSEMLTTHRAITLEVSVACAQCLISRILCSELDLWVGLLHDSLEPA
jgi:hypothetical protein